MAAILVVVVPAARGIWLELPSSGTRCVSEDLHNNVVVLADYYSFFGESYDENATITHPSVTIKVYSSLRFLIFPFPFLLVKKSKDRFFLLLLLECVFISWICIIALG